MEEQSRTYILEASDLSVSFETDAGEVQAVRDVSLSLKEGEVLAIVGESGCGKSVLCKSLMKMLPENARIKSGKILANGIDITGYKERDMANAFFHGISGSDDSIKSDDDNWQTDRRSN